MSFAPHAPRSPRSRPGKTPARGASSFDDLVGAGKDRGRHDDANRLGGVEINRQEELRGTLDRQLARPGAAYYSVHIFRRMSEDETQIGTERQQATILRITAHR